MYLRSIQSGVFKSLFECLKDVLVDVSLVFTETGIEVLSLDNARVSIVQVRLEASEFEEYSCQEKTVVGVNATQLFRLLKCVSGADVIEMRVTDGHVLQIDTQNPQKKSQSTFAVKILALNTENLEGLLDGISEPACITTFTSLDLQKLIREFGHVGSEMVITRSPGKIEFACTGDSASQNTRFDIEDDAFEGTPIGDRFNLKYLNLFLRASSLSSSVTLKHYAQEGGEGMPLVLEFRASSLGFVRFFLAPSTA